MDLGQRYPRSVREKLAGYVHFGRMIDKSRALLAGTQGEYIYPCPMDRRLLEYAGITAEQLLEEVRGRSQDEQVADWFLKTAAPHSEREIDAWNAMMLALAPDTDDQWQYFKKIRDSIDPNRGDVSTWADLLDLEEKRAVPARNAVKR